MLTGVSNILDEFNINCEMWEGLHDIDNLILWYLIKVEDQVMKLQSPKLLFCER